MSDDQDHSSKVGSIYSYDYLDLAFLVQLLTFCFFKKRENKLSFRIRNIVHGVLKSKRLYNLPQTDQN